MKQWESEGLVLRTRPYGESDKLVTLFTLKEGKVAALARGARKTRSKLAAAVDLFSRGDYLLYRGKSLATIQQVSLLNNYRAIREDVPLYFCALYICELLDKVLEECHPAESIYDLALETLQILNDGTASPELVAGSFEIMLLNELGYCPSLSGCLECGREEPPFVLSPSAGGLLCPACQREEKGFHLSPGNIALMQRILARGMQGIKVVKAPPRQLVELSRVTWEFLVFTTGIKNVKSRAYLEKPPQG
jgi:DNA repair protein RecO (recombination protein O)